MSMIGSFNIPSVEHLREGEDYNIVDWDFAGPSPAPMASHTPGESCPPNQKMVFGVCRTVNAAGEQQVGDDTDQEKALKDQARKGGSTVENNKAVSAGSKKYGWAMKGGKPILVEWGSVAGEKKVAPNKNAAPAKAPPAKAAPPAKTAPVTQPSASLNPAKLSTAERSAYAAGGGNAAVQRGVGSTTAQVIEQGKKNLGRMEQGKGRS